MRIEEVIYSKFHGRQAPTARKQLNINAIQLLTRTDNAKEQKRTLWRGMSQCSTYSTNRSIKDITIADSVAFLL